MVTLTVVAFGTAVVAGTAVVFGATVVPLPGAGVVVVTLVEIGTVVFGTAVTLGAAGTTVVEPLGAAVVGGDPVVAFVATGGTNVGSSVTMVVRV